MDARVCPHCHSTIDFSSVLTAVLPVKIDCKSCGKAFHVDSVWGWGAAGAAFVLGVAIWFGLTLGLGLSWKLGLGVVIVWGLIAEYLYFLGLRSGTVTSSLVDLASVEPATDVFDDGIVSGYRVIDDAVDTPVSEPEHQPETSAVAEPDASVAVYPRIKTQAFVESLQQVDGMDSTAMPLVSPLFGDLLLTYAIDTGDQFTALSEATAAQYGIDIDRVHDTALNNVIDYLRDIRVFNKDGMHELMCGGNMMATAVLFPELWDQIETEVGDAVVIAIPHRDTVLYVAQNDAPALASLRNALQGFESDDNHGLSTVLFIRDGSSWTPFQ